MAYVDMQVDLSSLSDVEHKRIPKEKVLQVIVNAPQPVLYGVQCTSAVTSYSTRAKPKGCMHTA